jgi:hypothetical protein
VVALPPQRLRSLDLHNIKILDVNFIRKFFKNTKYMKYIFQARSAMETAKHGPFQKC